MLSTLRSAVRRPSAQHFLLQPFANAARDLNKSRATGARFAVRHQQHQRQFWCDGSNNKANSYNAIRNCTTRKQPGYMVGSFASRHSMSVGGVNRSVQQMRLSFSGLSKKLFSSSSSGSSSSGGGPVAWYGRMLEESPLVTKAITSALIVLGGDLGCQLFIEGQSVDLARLARMFFLGGAMVAPVLHVWYGALFRWFPAPTLQGVLTRVVLDQAIFAPAFCGIFFTAIFALEGRMDQLENHLRENFVDAVKVNWMMWIPAQIINFKFIPPQFQVLFANFIALFWNSYLSWSGHKDQHHEEENVVAAVVEAKNAEIKDTN